LHPVLIEERKTKLLRGIICFSFCCTKLILYLNFIQNDECKTIFIEDNAIKSNYLIPQHTNYRYRRSAMDSYSTFQLIYSISFRHDTFLKKNKIAYHSRLSKYGSIKPSLLEQAKPFRFYAMSWKKLFFQKVKSTDSDRFFEEK
jgi:hypothetical protein